MDTTKPPALPPVSPAPPTTPTLPIMEPITVYLCFDTTGRLIAEGVAKTRKFTLRWDVWPRVVRIELHHCLTRAQAEETLTRLADEHRTAQRAARLAAACRP